ncbi:esterase-like activity of phytase family protein [uncultured Roseibium sp.]|uniref:esterase-like activity of phytase family protein n=1 Tax=uncultured Roseibium sp. TaxID=1936171 RepID=UPI00261145B1|nr:esterase-like activity of phytase family protein [uncultured Roseibium sp.]
MRLLLTTLILTAATSAFAQQTQFDATLAGHAVLPAETLFPAPSDAPDALKVSGKFTEPGNRRSHAAPTQGSALPFDGQPLQGFSGIKTVGDGTYYVLTDNGFGSKANSADAMLFFSRVRPDFDTGTVEIEDQVFLNDPDKVVPFPLTMEGTEKRYLTGADFDIEGFQFVGDQIVIGDEFGPFIIVADLESGKITEFHETVVDDVIVQSPDNPFIGLSNPDAPEVKQNIKRSRGYEGLAASVDGDMLFPLLEGPLWDTEKGAYETIADGRTALRLLEMNAQTREWTGRSWFYPVEAPDHAIGDFNMIDETRGLVIERDGGQGDSEFACKEGVTENCFKKPAAFKRIYLIDMEGVAPGEPVHKVAYIDLLRIQDPNDLVRQGKREDGLFTFPFVTIENVDRIDDTHIIVGNDNNFPFSAGRSLGAPDDNELILLEVGEFLKARAK